MLRQQEWKLTAFFLTIEALDLLNWGCSCLRVFRNESHHTFKEIGLRSFQKSSQIQDHKSDFLILLVHPPQTPLKRWQAPLEIRFYSQKHASPATFAWAVSAIRISWKNISPSEVLTDSDNPRANQEIYGWALNIIPPSFHTKVENMSDVSFFP